MIHSKETHNISLKTNQNAIHIDRSASSSQPIPLNQGDYASLNIHLLGRKITCLTLGAIQDAIALSCQRNQRITVANYNIHAFNLSFQLPWFHQFLKQSEIAHCDGLGILKALKFIGLDVHNQHRVSYTNLMPELLKQCDENNWSVFLLGSKPEYLERAIENLKNDYPNASFAGHHGYFSVYSHVINEHLIHQINEFRPNILIVGMGMPVQESWVQMYRDRLQVNAILVGGAVIDRLADVVSDCPRWISRRGFEWVYRLVKEPKRLASRYLIGNPAFVLQIILAKLQSLSERNRHAVWNRTISIEELLIDAPYLNQLPSKRKRIGEYLVERNLISPENLELALEEQLHTGERIGKILVSRGLINQSTVDELVGQLSWTNRNRSDQRKRIGEYLVELNLLSPENLELALEEQLHTGERIGEILANRGLISQNTVDRLVTQLAQTQRDLSNRTKNPVIGKTVDFLTEQLVALGSGNI